MEVVKVMAKQAVVENEFARMAVEIQLVVVVENESVVEVGVGLEVRPKQAVGENKMGLAEEAGGC